jgi:hypothetical protein
LGPAAEIDETATHASGATIGQARLRTRAESARELAY